MSAIERDREIAAKATQGEWRNRPASSMRDPEGRRTLNLWGKITAPVWSGTPHGASVADNADNDAEHIVRLHNRQPAEDSFIDKMLGLRRDIANNRRVITLSEIEAFLDGALDALDREDA